MPSFDRALAGERRRRHISIAGAQRRDLDDLAAIGEHVLLEEARQPARDRQLLERHDAREAFAHSERTARGAADPDRAELRVGLGEDLEERGGDAIGGRVDLQLVDAALDGDAAARIDLMHREVSPGAA